MNNKSTVADRVGTVIATIVVIWFVAAIALSILGLIAVALGVPGVTPVFIPLGLLVGWAVRAWQRRDRW